MSSTMDLESENHFYSIAFDNEVTRSKIKVKFFLIIFS